MKSLTGFVIVIKRRRNCLSEFRVVRLGIGFGGMVFVSERDLPFGNVNSCGEMKLMLADI